MLGLPVMVTGIKKQFFSEEENNKFLDCPHYLGIISILSCIISLWTALKNQIVICVLTLLTGIITVISAMIVLVSSALDLSGTPIEEMTDPNEHVNQQTHVVFIFSIGLLIASLAIVITAMSHLSARRVKREKSHEMPEKLSLPRVEECKESDTIPDHEDIMLNPGEKRYSFASTISSLIKHELKENKNISSDSKERLKKALSCPNDAAKSSDNSDIFNSISAAAGRTSTYSLPAAGSDYDDDILEKWRRASYLTQFYNQGSSETREVSSYI